MCAVKAPLTTPHLKPPARAWSTILKICSINQEHTNLFHFRPIDERAILMVLISADIGIYRMTENKTFGQIIREKRQELGISQKELASKIEKEDGSSISPQYENDIEFDRRDAPSEDMIRQYAKILGLHVDALLLAAGKVPDELRHFAARSPEKAQQVFQAFRKKSQEE